MVQRGIEFQRQAAAVAVDPLEREQHELVGGKLLKAQAPERRKFLGGYDSLAVFGRRGAVRQGDRRVDVKAARAQARRQQLRQRDGAQLFERLRDQAAQRFLRHLARTVVDGGQGALDLRLLAGVQKMH